MDAMSRRGLLNIYRHLFEELTGSVEDVVLCILHRRFRAQPKTLIDTVDFALIRSNVKVCELMHQYPKLEVIHTRTSLVEIALVLIDR